jgi:hypothetical protein
MNSVEALDYALGVLDRNRCVGPCWEHDGCRLIAEAAETLTALRDTIAAPFGGTNSVRRLS